MPLAWLKPLPTVESFIFLGVLSMALKWWFVWKSIFSHLSLSFSFSGSIDMKRQRQPLFAYATWAIEWRTGAWSFPFWKGFFPAFSEIETVDVIRDGNVKHKSKDESWLECDIRVDVELKLNLPFSYQPYISTCFPSTRISNTSKCNISTG